MLRITLNRVPSVNVFPPFLGFVSLSRVSEKEMSTSSIRVVATLVVHSSSRVCAVVWAVANSYSLSGDGDLRIYLSLNSGESSVNDLVHFGFDDDPLMYLLSLVALDEFPVCILDAPWFLIWRHQYVWQCYLLY